MLSNISAMITEANQCKEELQHIKHYHNDSSSEDLAAQFRLAERVRHIEQIERRIATYMTNLQTHKQKLIELIEIESAQP